MNLLSGAINRAYLRKQRFIKRQKKSNWKEGRETHKVTLKTEIWFSVDELSKEKNMTTDELFEYVLIKFIHWHKFKYITFDDELSEILK